MEHKKSRRFQVEHLDHVAITVSDVNRSVAWYEDVLGLERRYQETLGDTPAMLFAGTTAVVLIPAAVSRPIPSPDVRTAMVMRHLSFRVTGDAFDSAQEELQHRGIPFNFEDHSICHSIYLRDPDNYEIELTTYEIRAREPETVAAVRASEPRRTLRLRMPPK